MKKNIWNNEREKNIKISTVKIWVRQNELQYPNKQTRVMVLAPQKSIILKWTLSFKILFSHSSFANSLFLNNFRIPSYGYPGEAGHLARRKKKNGLMLSNDSSKGGLLCNNLFFWQELYCSPPLKSEIPF